MSIQQQVSFDCRPEKLYQILLSSTAFVAMTGAAADIDAEEGGAFSCFDGQITGRTTKLVEGREIVQQWRVGAWSEGQHSTVRFLLEPAGEGTRLTLEQSGHPKDAADHLDAGWHQMYWDPLAAYLRG